MNTYLEDDSWIQPCLTEGEQLLWTGRPGDGHLTTKQDFFLIPFSVLWGAFVLVYEGVAIFNPLAFLFGIPFLAIGCYITFGRFLHKRARRRSVSYAITNQRIITKRGEDITYIQKRNLPPMNVTHYPDGQGKITFGLDDFVTPFTPYGRFNLASEENIIGPVNDVDRVVRFIQME